MEDIWKKILRLLYKLDNLLHIIIAFVLLGLSFVTVIRVFFSLQDFSYISIIHAVNDVLLALIIAELLWPVLKFLKKEEFSLNPFLFVGIISATRKLLFLEAKQTMGESDNYMIMMEQGVTVFIIFMLIIVYYIYSRIILKKE